MILIRIVLCMLSTVCAFAFTTPTPTKQSYPLATMQLNANEGNEATEKSGPLSGLFDMFSNMDAIADDFFYKRMGKGEIFYGKRQYKPSGDVEGDYNGFGLSDKLKIDMTRDYKDEWMEEKLMRDEIRMLKEEKEKRNA